MGEKECSKSVASSNAPTSIKVNIIDYSTSVIHQQKKERNRFWDKDMILRKYDMESSPAPRAVRVAVKDKRDEKDNNNELHYIGRD